jgi:hypothetical protein
MTLRSCITSNKNVVVKPNYSLVPFTFGKPREMLVTVATRGVHDTKDSTQSIEVRGYRSDAQIFSNQLIIDVRIWSEDGIDLTREKSESVMGLPKNYKTIWQTKKVAPLPSCWLVTVKPSSVSTRVQGKMIGFDNFIKY